MLREKKLVCWASEELHRRDVNDANANAVVVTSKADGVPAPLTDRYLSLIKAFCPAPRLQVGFFSPLLSWPSNRSQFPSLFSWLPCSPVQVSAPPHHPSLPVPPSQPTLGQTIRGYTGVFQLRPRPSVVLGLVRDPHMLRSHTW